MVSFLFGFTLGLVFLVLFISYSLFYLDKKYKKEHPTRHSELKRELRVLGAWLEQS